MTILYHGTLLANIPSIRRTGIRGSKRSFQDRVFASKTPGIAAITAAGVADDFGGIPVVIQFRTNKQIFTDPEFDDPELSENESVFIKGIIPPKDIIKVVPISEL